MVCLSYMMEFGYEPTHRNSLISGAPFLPKELPVRITRRARELHTLLPYGFSHNQKPALLKPLGNHNGQLSIAPATKTTALEMEMEQAAGAGGKMVVELVGAFNQLTGRMALTSSSSSSILFKALKLSIPLLHALPLSPDGRSPLSKALSVALVLADLHMDAEVISASILRHLGATISVKQVTSSIGTGTAHLLHESLRVTNLPSAFKRLDPLDDDQDAAALRKFCLTHYDIRALILELAMKLDAMRHLDHLARYHQQLLALQVMKIHAPLAHAVGTHLLSLELEDLCFRYLFPYSYLYVDTWLRSHNEEAGKGRSLVDVYREELLESLKADSLLGELVSDISVKGRYKSRYSTMKKLLKDGRRPEEVNDVLGLRVILHPRISTSTSSDEIKLEEIGARACYRTCQIVQSLWKEMPHRTKDYIANPKPNGYRSLHMAVDVSTDDGRTRPSMEIQIRTSDMDVLASGGTASHSLYKAGLSDPQEAKRLKAIMVAAAELAALRLKDLPSTNHKGFVTDQRNRVFRLLDKNGDGRISIEELMETMEELGAPGEDAREMMRLLDSNSDGSLSSDEFDLFQEQVEFMRNLEATDDQYKMMLYEKLQTVEDSGSIQVCNEAPGSSLAT